eukprot:Em0001g2930a
MGRRKFRLGIHRKNEERAKHSFIVSIQRTDVVVHVSTLAVTTSELETPVDPSPLTCSVPLIVISEGVVQTLDALATRLRLLNPFTSWTVADQGVLIISKMHFVVTQSPKVFSYCLSRDTSADLKSQTDEHVQFLAHQTCVEGDPSDHTSLPEPMNFYQQRVVEVEPGEEGGFPRITKMADELNNLKDALTGKTALDCGHRLSKKSSFKAPHQIGDQDKVPILHTWIFP